MGVVNEYTVKTRGYGLPDYAQAKPTGAVAVGPVYTSTDAAELAARLGSPDIFDRRGNVIFLDNFENGVNNWYRGGYLGISNEIVSWNSDFSKDGGFSCKLETEAIVNGSTSIVKGIGFPAMSLMGLECSFGRDAYWRYFTIAIRVREATQRLYATVRYVHASSSFQYVGDDHGWHDIPGLSFTAIPRYYSEVTFHTMKLVADFITGNYVRFIIDNQMVDLSGIGLMADPAGGGTPYLEVTSGLTTDGGGAATGYIDNVVVTQNEPANIPE